MDIVSLCLVPHIAGGTIALCALPLAIGAKKGSTLHKRAGIVFYYAMLIMAIAALGVTIPKQNWLFLCIAVFSAYLTLSGRRALAWRAQGKPMDTRPDAALAYAVAAAGLGLLLIGTSMLAGVVFTQDATGWAFLVFGGISLLNAYNDLHTIANGHQAKVWLRTHITKMIAAGISATTAFFVVNSQSIPVPMLVIWLGPTVLGTALIIYWRLRVAKGNGPAMVMYQKQP